MPDALYFHEYYIRSGAVRSASWCRHEGLGSSHAFAVGRESDQKCGPQPPSGKNEAAAYFEAFCDGPE